MKFFPLLIFTWMSISLFLKAQDEEVPTPKMPLLPRAPEMSSWKVAFKNSHAAPSIPGQAAVPSDQVPVAIQSMDVQKTGKIYHCVVNWVSGQKSDTWIFGTYQLTKYGNSPYVPISASGPKGLDFSQSDFEDINWLNMQYYAGLKAGNKVFVFEIKSLERPPTRMEVYALKLVGMAPLDAADNKAPEKMLDATRVSSAQVPVSASAFDSQKAIKEYKVKLFKERMSHLEMDVATQMPIEYDDGAVDRTYTFNPPPTQMLVPPPEVLDGLRQQDAFIKATTIHPSPP